jgi:hypothetical protein
LQKEKRRKNRGKDREIEVIRKEKKELRHFVTLKEKSMNAAYANTDVYGKFSLFPREIKI